MSDGIDAHHHLWNLTAVDYPWLKELGAKRFFGDPTPIQRDYLFEEYSRDAIAAGMSGSIHVQVGAADGLSEAKWVQSVADQHADWTLGQVVFCDLLGADREERLDAFRDLSSVRGVRQIVGRAEGEDAATGTNALLGSPDFMIGLRILGERNLTFDLQLTPSLMSRAARMLETVRDTQIVLCHAGSPQDRTPKGIAEWQNQLSLLARLPNVACKLSGLGMFDHTWTVETIRPIVDACLDLFGPDRCMFGSNFPVDSLYSNYETLHAAYKEIVPEQMHAAVFGLTARRVYGLPCCVDSSIKRCTANCSQAAG